MSPSNGGSSRGNRGYSRGNGGYSRPGRELPDFGDRRPVRMAARWVLILGGWALFVVWWGRVLPQADLWFRQVALVQFVLLTLLLPAVTVLWVMHNIGVARRGRRGACSPYVFSAFRSDLLGRKYHFVMPERLRAAAHVRISVEGQHKFYEDMPVVKAEAMHAG